MTGQPAVGRGEIVDEQWRGAETARDRMVVEVPSARPGDTVEDARHRLMGQTFASVEAVYVVDEGGRLLGMVALPALLARPGAETLGSIMTRDPPSVQPEEDQETLATLAVEHGLPSVPVVDERGRLLGAVPQVTLMAILYEEHVEDLHRLAGMRHRSEWVLDALRQTPFRRLEYRLPWLLVGLLGSGVAAWIMSRFADVLEAWVVVAFFLPGIVYLAAAIGTQTATISVRGLSVGGVRLLDLLGGEIATGLLIGAALAALSFPAIWLAFGDLRLAGAVALAVIAAGTVATAIGLLLPWGLARAGSDPAFGTGPLATVIQDILSILVYLALVRALVM